MAFEEKKIDDYEAYTLLIRIDSGHSITEYEKHMLSSITSISWNSFTISKLPRSLENLEALSMLDLSNTNISDISTLSNMKSLSCLFLNNTLVSDISALSNLESLLMLDLSNTRVDDISALSNLTSLSSLNMSDSNVYDINALSNLESLSTLNLNCTRVNDIRALSGLKSLSILNLNSTEVSDISALSHLKSLSTLSLNKTKVSDISALSGLKNLITLELSGLIIKDLSALSEVISLRVLNIQNSKTSSIPESLVDMELSFIIERREFISIFEEGIFIYGLTLTDLPIEIFSQKRELIRAYYREKIQVPVNECKVIFLGDAESGKTHSIKRLLINGEYLDGFDGEATHGIEITVNPIKLTNTDIVVNYWDFGGQEIQHSMHRVFLTERTVYVVFLNARQDELIDERARYWMENIKAFAPNAPVLVVINKIDQNDQPRFNKKGFIDSFGDQVKKIIRLSAKKDEKQVFLDKLQGNINSIIMDMPTVSKRIPRSWKNLMESIREMENNYLTTEQFIEKCKSNSIMNYKEIHDELVDLFQVVGVSFCYYKDRSIADYLLLNPKWMLNALYTIVVNGKVVAKNGVIIQNDLYDLLEKDTVNGIKISRVIPNLRYKSFEVNYILGVIRMFGLSYSLKDGSEFFPMLCDGDEKISVKEAVPGDALHFIFRYTYLPTNVMHRLIVEMQRDLDYQYVWYTGAVFRNTQQNQTAYIHSLGNDLHIYVYGEDRYYNLNEYLTPITNIVRDINNNMGIISSELLTFRKNGVEAEISYEDLMGNIRNGINAIYKKEVDGTIRLDILSHRYFDKGIKIDNLLKSVVYALQAMQNDKTYYSIDENSRNRFISEHLTAQLKGTRYTCADQQPGGTSASGKAPGERDFVIKDEIGQEILIYEGLNLKSFNTAYLDKHIDKVLVNYNPQGLRYSILVTYLECNRDRFSSFISKYREHIEGYAPDYYRCIGGIEDIRFAGGFLSCMKMKYAVGEQYFAIYHIIVRMGQ